MKFAPAVSLLGVVVAVAVGCGGQPQQAAPSSATGPTAPPAPVATVASLVDAQWMGFERSEPWSWRELERRITPDFQLFGFRPIGENESPHPCQGCGVNPPTAEVTVYAPGEFDPMEAQADQPVDVNGQGGLFRAAQPDLPTDDTSVWRDGMLTWQYADDAWATVRGMTTMTSELDRMLELAGALRPTERTPVRVPLSLVSVPPQWPLVSVHTSHEPIYGYYTDYGTTLDFGPCVSLTKEQECTEKSDETGFLRVAVLRRDDFTEGRHREEVDRKIGGKDGRYDKSVYWAAVMVQKGTDVEFALGSPRDREPVKEFEDVLDGVVWAPDPGDDATWPPVTDWVKQ